MDFAYERKKRQIEQKKETIFNYYTEFDFDEQPEKQHEMLARLGALDDELKAFGAAKRTSGSKANRKGSGNTRQYLPISFDVLDNVKFRNGLMKKDRFRTYLWLRRYVVRGNGNGDRLHIHDNYWRKGRLATGISARRLAKDLGIGRSTATDHIHKLKDEGVLKVEQVHANESWDGQRHNIYVLGTHEDGKEKWFIDDVFGTGNE